MYLCKATSIHCSVPSPQVIVVPQENGETLISVKNKQPADHRLMLASGRARQHPPMRLYPLIREYGRRYREGHTDEKHNQNQNTIMFDLTKTPLRGIVPPLVTPLTDNETLFGEALY